jgi:ABC-type multidrug transport system ATPase subunit
MKRRLLVAARWSIAPQILVSDEPTAGADIEPPATGLREGVNRQGVTVVLTTH